MMTSGTVPYLTGQSAAALESPGRYSAAEVIYPVKKTGQQPRFLQTTVSAAQLRRDFLGKIHLHDLNALTDFEAHE